MFHRGKNYQRRNKHKNSKIGFVFTLIVFIFLFKFFYDFNGGYKKNTVDVSNETEASQVESSSIDSIDNYEEETEDNDVSSILNEYKNLGIVKCNSYINFRSEPNEKNTRSIIGLMRNGDACDILEMNVKGSDIYAKVTSGGMTGYVAKQYLIVGNDAIELAKKNIAERAIVLVDKLRMRSTPNQNEDNIIGRTYKGERYRINNIDDNWIKVYADNLEDHQYAYISNNKDYVKISKCLSEAITQDLKSDVLNYYDNLGIANVKDYVNIRKTAKSNGTIIGKLPKMAGCEILSESGDFYRIKSGIVTGYVSKKYIATGKKAEELALQNADLRAIVKIAALRVRSAPSTKAKAWTTITKEETYIVVNQLDGWVEIELDDNDDKSYISTQNNYVEVRYALEQAVEFHPTISTSITTTRNNIRNYAIQFIGGPYVWGGNSLTNGCDCSGFVQQIYKKYGVTLPRTSRDQAKKGVAVNEGSRKVGDLIFYANSNGVVDHVAIYIGNNQIVHAASTKSGIRISKYNYRTIHSIRNVLGNK